MLAKKTKYRKKLSDKQITLLKMLFKFRFATTDLLAVLYGKDRSTLYEALYILEKQGYVHKFHDKTFRLRGRPAIYCLAATGIRYLINNTDIDQTTLKNFYKNKKLALENEEHVDQCLLVFQIYNNLKASLGNIYYIYTSYELERNRFVNPRPLLFLHTKDQRSKKPDYVLDIFPAGTFSWLLTKRLRAHQEFSEEFEYRYPDVLLVAGNESTEKRLFKQVAYAMQDFNFYITQQEMLLNDGQKNGKLDKIWIDVEESDEDEWERVGVPLK